MSKQNGTAQSPSNGQNSSEVNPLKKDLIGLQKSMWYTQLMDFRKNQKHAQHVGEAAAAASYDHLHRSGQLTENHWQKSQEIDEEMGDELNVDSPTTINLNVPLEHAGRVASQLSGIQTPTMEGNPQPLPPPAPGKSLLEKLWPALLASGALAWFIGRDFIPEDTRPEVGLDQGVFELVDEDGNPAPLVAE